MIRFYSIPKTEPSEHTGDRLPTLIWKKNLKTELQMDRINWPLDTLSGTTRGFLEISLANNYLALYKQVPHFFRRVHANLGSCDTFLKIVSLLQNYWPEGGKSIKATFAIDYKGSNLSIYLESSLSRLSKNTKIITIDAVGKKLQRPKSRICRDVCIFASNLFPLTSFEIFASNLV